MADNRRAEAVDTLARAYIAELVDWRLAYGTRSPDEWPDLPADVADDLRSRVLELVAFVPPTMSVDAARGYLTRGGA